MRETTGKNSASNYGVEDFIVNGGNSAIAVYENSDGGPYWTHPHKGLNRPEADISSLRLTAVHTVTIVHLVVIS